MKRTLIIGCGGVATVAIHKCCQNSEIFEEIMIASRTKSKCDKLKAQLDGKTKTIIHTAQVDADNVEELVEMCIRDRVLTAKSIACYNKIAEDSDFAEYYLIGTLYSVLITILFYIILFKI